LGQVVPTTVDELGQSFARGKRGFIGGAEPRILPWAVIVHPFGVDRVSGRFADN
jgi:hypothetical protein